MKKRKPKRKKSRLVLSTGSTRLDLAITGMRLPEGGIPAGIIVELFGPSAGGKTAIACELAASCQRRGGKVTFLDPEGRVDKKYCELFGMDWSDIDYDMPDTVEDTLGLIDKDTVNPEVINLCIIDSAAALSTDLEMKKGDKMGMRRGKVFSELFRKIARRIRKDNRILLFTNQVRQTQTMFGSGEVTPGGKSLEFYSSLRVRVGEVGKVRKENKAGFEKVIGIRSKAYVKKSSIDDPFREEEFTIIFNYGVDDIRDNIQWLRKNTTVMGEKKGWFTFGKKKSQSILGLISHIEENNLEGELKEIVRTHWRLLDNSLKEERKPKVRH